MPLKTFFFIILAALFCPFATSSGAGAGPIFPEQARREEALMPAPVERKMLPVTVKHSKTKMEPSFTIDTRDGLNADEAGLLAILINPEITGLREKKGLFIPQLVKSGAVAPLRLLADKGEEPASWLPRERLRLALKTVRAMKGTAPGGSLDLESSWLEWQAFEAARLHMYRMIKSRRAIELLRQIKKVYKDIYKATSEEKLKRLYPKQRATAKLGYEKMKKSLSRELKELSAGRVGLDHALGLPTYVEVSLEHDMSLPMPSGLPALKELTERLNNRRIDFMALQKGITEKDVPLMNYIKSRFAKIDVFIPLKTPAQWLDTAGVGLEMDLPMFSDGMGIMAVGGANGERLYRDYKYRIKRAVENISRLLQGIGFISDEIEKIDETLPVLIKAAKDAGKGDDTVKALQKEKTLLAVRLLRLRLTGRLVDATMALEMASGARLIKPSAP